MTPQALTAPAAKEGVLLPIRTGGLESIGPINPPIEQLSASVSNTVFIGVVDTGAPPPGRTLVDAAGVQLLDDGVHTLGGCF